MSLVGPSGTSGSVPSRCLCPIKRLCFRACLEFVLSVAFRRLRNVFRRAGVAPQIVFKAQLGIPIRPPISAEKQANRFQSVFLYTALQAS